MKAFLIGTSVFVFIVLLVISVYTLVYFQHPHDRRQAWFSKITVVFGMITAGSTILLLPLDVANRGLYAGCAGFDKEVCGGLDMEMFWNIQIWEIFLMLVFVIPMSTFYYESSGDKTNKARIKEMFCSELFFIATVGLIFSVLYSFYHTITIPVQEVHATTLEATPSYDAIPSSDGSFHTNQLANMTDTDRTNVVDNSVVEPMMLVMTVSFTTFVTCNLCFLGWFFFAIFSGIGIIALPLDLILSYWFRPKYLEPTEFLEREKELQIRVNNLVQVGELIKAEREADALNQDNSCLSYLSASERKRKREKRNTFLEFGQAVRLLQIDNEVFQDGNARRKSYNSLLPYLWLTGGVISSILSTLWILQMTIYVLPAVPINPFMNDFLVFFDLYFPLIGVGTIAVMICYLMLCAIKGCFKFGLRFVVIPIHPMEVNKTYMSSFLFNISLILLCALPCVQMSVAAFGTYAQYANASQIFGVEIMYLGFFQWFFEEKVFYYAWIITVCLAAIGLAFRPRERRNNGTVLRERVENCMENEFNY